LTDIQNVKTTLAIVCSLLLAWTPVLAPASAAGAVRVAPVCCHCGKACCVATPSPESRPVPATPVSISAPGQFLTLAPAGLSWTLPDALTPRFSNTVASPGKAKGIPLYARNCAFLL